MFYTFTGLLVRRLGFLLSAACALAACSAAQPRPETADRATRLPAVAIYLIAHEGHTGIAIARVEIPPDVWPESRDFPSADYLEVGWGDRAYYFGREQGVWGTLSAGLWPTPSVVHVVGIRGPPAKSFPRSEIIELMLSREGFDRLLVYIDDAFDRTGSAPAVALGPGLYGDGRFYPGWESFHVFRTCNVWTARALRTAGLSIHDSITRDGLMKQAQAIGKVVNEP